MCTSPSHTVHQALQLWIYKFKWKGAGLCSRRYSRKGATHEAMFAIKDDACLAHVYVDIVYTSYIYIYMVRQGCSFPYNHMEVLS